MPSCGDADGPMEQSLQPRAQGGWRRMEHVGAARDLVLAYVHDLNAIDEAVRVAIPSLERLADVLGLARSRQINRSGHVGTYSYTVHGAGCRFVCDNGTEVDVDSAADGAKSSTSGGCVGMG
ncbi:DUF6896 domain-containing protein [Streptomyces olivaceus]|uniref:DUF6896 domain-containing protein n=1 Tax=Streptomyces olivaceus TaxID=47716 RepID=UPI0038035EC0